MAQMKIKSNFYKNKKKQKIHDFGDENVTICVDWNLVLIPDIDGIFDTENYLHVRLSVQKLDISVKFTYTDKSLTAAEYRLNKEKR